MKIIRPAVIGDAALVSSSVPETAPAAWVAGTTYGLGVLVSIFAGTVATVYESLAAGNVGNAPATSPAWWRFVSTTYAAYNAATTYGLKERVIDPVSHRTYESLQAANAGHTPAVSPTWWIDIGPTNRWAMFDAYNQTLTQRTSSIEVTLAPTGLVNALALLNIEAASVNVIVTDAVAGQVYNRTFELISTSNVGADFYAWAFEPIIRRSDLHVEGLPAYLNPTIKVTISFSNSTAKIGNLVAGMQRELGTTVMGAGFGIIDHSRKEVDEFGNIDLVVRSYRKVGTFEVVVAREMVDEVGRLLASYRAEPTVYVGTGEYSSSIYYGFFRDFRLNVEHYIQSKLTLEIEGLS